MDFFQTCQETKSPNRTHEKKSGSKVSNFVHGKISKKSGSKIWKSYSWKSCIFLGDVQPKMCGINFPKNKQSCYQLLSKTSKVVISCYRVNTSKNRVVIKNKQVVISCYQLLSSCYHVWVSTILAKKCPFWEFNDWNYFMWKNVHSQNSMIENFSYVWWICFLL